MQDDHRRFFNLAGKDYFTEQEAAFYACVSYSQFRQKAIYYGITPFEFMGKRVFRRTDLAATMEQAAQVQRIDEKSRPHTFVDKAPDLRPMRIRPRRPKI